MSSKGLQKANLDFCDGRICRIADWSDNSGPQPEQIIDIEDRWLMPGAVDAHTHFGMPLSKGLKSLDWRQSSEAALLGGTTTIVDFANPHKGQPLAEAVNQWQEAAAHRCLCDYSFHVTVVDTSEERLQEIPALVAAGLPTFKGFLAYKGRLMLEPERLKKLMASVHQANGMLLVHAEDGQMNAEAESILRDTGRIAPRWHPLAHPEESEVKAVAEAVAMALDTDCPLLVVHMSLAQSLDRLLDARTRREHSGLNTPLFGEVCLQHLLADDQLYEAGHEAALGAICSPPLRNKSNNLPLINGLKNNSLNILSTDHCEFPLKTKAEASAGGFYMVPNGCGGVGERLVLSYTHLVANELMSVERWVETLCEKPADIVGLGHRKGYLKEGFDADLVVFNPNPEYRWTPLGQSDRHGSLWNGMSAQGAVQDVWLRGKQTVQNARLIQEQPGGEFLPRKLSLKDNHE
ncbi:MAG: amidohydrolase family protein [bacterium]|nr:amidohydrolase family protein [bacterium]